MNKFSSLLSMFRLPALDVGEALWECKDLTGSNLSSRFNWDASNQLLSVQSYVDDQPSSRVIFKVVAGSLRVQEATGISPDISGSRQISQYLASSFMQGDVPVILPSMRGPSL